MKGIFDRQPAMTLGVIQAFMALLMAFGFHITAEQLAAIIAFSSVTLAWITQKSVVPNDKHELVVDTALSMPEGASRAALDRKVAREEAKADLPPAA